MSPKARRISGSIARRWPTAHHARGRAAARDRAAREGMAGGALDRARAGARGARVCACCCRGATRPSGGAAPRSPRRCRTQQCPILQPLDQVARMIARAAFVVGVDTGLLHLAAALGVPLVAIFLGTEPGQHGPLGAGKIEIVGALGEMPSVDDVARRRGADRALARRLHAARAASPPAPDRPRYRACSGDGARGRSACGRAGSRVSRPSAPPSRRSD